MSNPLEILELACCVGGSLKLVSTLLYGWLIFCFENTCFWRRRRRFTEIMFPDQCDRIGLFFEFLGHIFFHKSSPNIRVFLGIFKNTTFMENIIWLLFRQYWENWATSYSIIWSHCPRSFYNITYVTSQSSVSHWLHVFIIFARFFANLDAFYCS